MHRIFNFWSPSSIKFWLKSIIATFYSQYRKVLMGWEMGHLRWPRAGCGVGGQGRDNYAEKKTAHDIIFVPS